MSMNMIHTFSFGVMHSFSTFTVFDSRIPRSTTRASSIAVGLGGPDSNVGLARGTSSALVDRTPWFGVPDRVRHGGPWAGPVPPPERVPLDLVDLLRRADGEFHRLRELVRGEVAVHLEEDDLARPRDDRHRAVRLPEVVLILVQVEGD